MVYGKTNNNIRDEAIDPLGEIRLGINEALSLIMYDSSYIAEKRKTTYMEHKHSLELCWEFPKSYSILSILSINKLKQIIIIQSLVSNRGLITKLKFYIISFHYISFFKNMSDYYSEH